MSATDIAFAKSGFSKALKGFGTRAREEMPERKPADLQARKKAERRASNARPRTAAKAKRNSQIGLRCTVKVKMIALEAQNRRGASSISDSIIVAILKDAADLGVEGAAELLEGIEQGE